jgi:hypothetical protein
MAVRSDQRTLADSIGGKATVAGARVGAACEETCRQDVNGIGQGTPSQSSQWLHGAFARLRSIAGAADGTAAAVTVVTPLAKTARQPRTAARARTRFMGRI